MIHAIGECVATMFHRVRLNRRRITGSTVTASTTNRTFVSRCIDTVPATAAATGRDRGRGDRGGDREDPPQQDVLEHRRAEHQAGEPGVQNAEVVEDLRDDRNRRHGRRNGEDENEGGLAARWSP